MLAQNFIDFPENFEFGLANAPAHAEDELNDSWLDFARAGKVKVFTNQARPRTSSILVSTRN